MAIRGRKPNPKTAVNPEMPAATSSSPASASLRAPPEQLDKYGREHWEYCIPLLAEQGLFTPLDRGPFTLVCEAWSIYRRCQVALKRSLVMTTKTGYQQQRPQYSMMQQAWNSYTKLAEQFGLTPVSRGRLDPNGFIPGAAVPDAEDDVPEKYLD